MSGGEKQVFFAREISRFPTGKTRVFPHGLRKQTAHVARGLCAVAGGGMRVFGKVEGEGRA